MVAIAVARENNNLPIKKFFYKETGNFAQVLQDKGEFTIINGN